MVSGESERSSVAEACECVSGLDFRDYAAADESGSVKSYYTRFLEELPDIKALAEVPEDRLLKLWEGLGYYNRRGI